MDNNFDFNDQIFSMPGNEYQPHKPQVKKKKQKKHYGIGTVILSSVLAALIGGLSAIGVFSLVRPAENIWGTATQNSGSPGITNISIDETAENAIQAVAQKVTPSVVGIVTTQAKTGIFGNSSASTGEGSGIIYTADGYIITNYHVISSVLTTSNSKIEVYLAGNTESSYEATVVGYNVSNDLAVIKINAQNLTKIELGSSKDVKVGQFVAAIGNPGGMQFMGSVTYGIVSGLNRVVSDNSGGDEVTLIQTDAAINPGNSGGALVNIKGELIGVNSSKIAATEYEGMGFAIPVDDVKEICDRIISKEYEPNPYVGITVNSRYDAETLEELGYPAGAVVQSVASGSPAYETGIRSGDIIVEFNGVAISEYSDLYDEVQKTSPGQSVKVKIYRGNKYYSANLTIGSNNSQ